MAGLSGEVQTGVSIATAGDTFWVAWDGRLHLPARSAQRVDQCGNARGLHVGEELLASICDDDACASSICVHCTPTPLVILTASITSGLATRDVARSSVCAIRLVRRASPFEGVVMADDAPKTVELLPDGFVLEWADRPGPGEPAIRSKCRRTPARGQRHRAVAARTFYSVGDSFANVLQWVRAGAGANLVPCRHGCAACASTPSAACCSRFRRLGRPMKLN